MSSQFYHYRKSIEGYKTVLTNQSISIPYVQVKIDSTARTVAETRIYDYVS